MHRPRLQVFALAVLVLGAGCKDTAASVEPAAPAPDRDSDPDPDPAAQAAALAQRLIILDGHVDMPHQVVSAQDREEPTPPVHAHTETDFDYPRAKAGGLDAPFMSIYTPAKLQAEAGASKRYAERNIDLVLALAADHPEKFALAKIPDEVRANFERGLVSLPMGMENGSPIEGELTNVAYFYERGIRYITLTHSKDNLISDSSYDDAHTHGGLSEFGNQVVAEMNRLGIMVDVSHISDAAFWQVMERSAVPVIASHSSCRHFTPGFERNMSDEMIEALAAHDGVIQINFGGSFLSQPYRDAEGAGWEVLEATMAERGLEWGDAETQTLIEAYQAEHPIPKLDLGVVADHIDHVVSLVGVEHVGLGSDFDGVGDSLPTGLSDVSMYPNLIRVLLERGYSEVDIEKICAGNVLRVWQTVEDYAAPRR